MQRNLRYNWLQFVVQHRAYHDALARFARALKERASHTGGGERGFCVPNTRARSNAGGADFGVMFIYHPDAFDHHDRSE